MMQDNPRMHFRYKKKKNVVSVGSSIEEYTKEDCEVAMNMVEDKDMVEEEEYHPHASILVILVMYHGSTLSHV
jgi:hypothetical protein